ncbi:MAG: sugar ABC transporter substrate-binding protein, partial [Lachnospiraceae bacterium]|nr:sugar ABC transporter substrate-binding protein [Lachnospiraceae bacterium]
MKKRILSCILAGIMVASTLAGCGSSNTGSAQAGSDNKPASTTEVEGNAATEDDKSPITFTYYNADGKNSSWDNPVAKAITEATGVTLEVSYPVSTQGEPKEDVALMIASDDYPDMIYAKGSATDLYEAGAFIDMTDLIEQYGPNIKKMYGDELEKLKWGEGDDGIYQLSYSGV